jgi:hypothetical protein
VRWQSEHVSMGFHFSQPIQSPFSRSRQTFAMAGKSKVQFGAGVALRSIETRPNHACSDLSPPHVFDLLRVHRLPLPVVAGELAAKRVAVPDVGCRLGIEPMLATKASRDHLFILSVKER